MPSKPINFFKANKIITLVFIITLAIWLWQRSTGFGWDFSSYSLNAEYFYGTGEYLEIMRPPLASVVMFPSGLNRALGEYFYIVFVSLLFLYSTLKLADTLKLNRTAFYIFSLTPFSIALGFTVGTELFSLSLLNLSVAFLYTKKSGIFLGLLALLRYTNIFYLPILLFQKNIKKIILSLIVFSLLFSGWLVYNWYLTGDPLTSLKDFYALNIKYRDYIPLTMPKVEDILFAFNFTIPFLILGIYSRIKKIGKTDVLMFVIMAITILVFIRTPIKEPRYLYSLVLPAAYFATLSLKKIKFKYIVPTFLVITLITTAFLVPAMKLIDPSNYKEIVSKVNCAAKSNIWVALNYYGLSTDSPSRGLQVYKDIEDGYRVIIQYGPEGDDVYKDIQNLSIIENTTSYMIIGDKTKCKAIGTVTHRYLKNLNEYLNSTYNYTVPTDFFGVFLGK
ncbi:MAG TPA: hypothetical protein VJA47_06190 [archaeon]|nr:hypothetical protein [archaeon]